MGHRPTLHWAACVTTALPGVVDPCLGVVELGELGAMSAPQA